MMRLLLLTLLIVPVILQAQTFNWVSIVETNDDDAVFNGMAMEPGTDNVYAGGYFIGDLGPLGLLFATDEDGLLVKYNSAGGQIWSRQINAFNCVINDVCTDPAGNVYCVGRFAGSFDADPGLGTNTLASQGGTDIIIIKYTSTGNYVWAESAGGINNDEGLAITADASGVYIGGYYDTEADFGALTTNNHVSGQDGFVAKYDLNGNEQWVRDFGANVGPDQTNDDFVTSLDNDGSNIYVLSQFASKTLEIRQPNNSGSFGSVTNYQTGGGTDPDLAIISYTSSGAFNYVQKMGSVKDDKAGGVYYESGLLFISGAMEDNPTFPSGNVMGLTDGQDIFLGQFNAITGVDNWTIIENNASGGNDDFSLDVYGDGNGTIFTVGRMDDDILFDGLTTVFEIGSKCAFIASYCVDGTFNWAEAGGSSGTDAAYGVTANANFAYFGGVFDDDWSYGGNSNSIDSKTVAFMAQVVDLSGCTGCVTPPVGGSASITGSPFCPGSNVNLVLTGYAGSIIWQESLDGGVTWSDVSGATTDNENFFPN